MQNQIIPAITVKENKAITTSLEIARVFEKEHKDVLRAIKNLIAKDDDFNQGKNVLVDKEVEIIDNFNRLNFKPVEYIDSKGEKRPMYEMTRDGFTLLAMGFTGRRILQFKIAYIEAFNKMEQALTASSNAGLADNLEFAMKLMDYGIKDRSALRKFIYYRTIGVDIADIGKLLKVKKYKELDAFLKTCGFTSYEEDSPSQSARGDAVLKQTVANAAAAPERIIKEMITSDITKGTVAENHAVAAADHGFITSNGRIMVVLKSLMARAENDDELKQYSRKEIATFLKSIGFVYTDIARSVKGDKKRKFWEISLDDFDFDFDFTDT